MRVLRNTAGYIQGGVFHPIRGGAGYDPTMVGEKAKPKKRKAAAKKKKPVAKKKTVKGGFYAKAVKKAAPKKKKKAARKNPSMGTGKWIKNVEAVRVNKNKTIDILYRKR